MANVFQFVDWLSMEGLRLLVNKLEVSQGFNTDYNSEFTKDFAVGETVRVPLPQQFTIRNGLGYNPQAINRVYTTVTCDQIFGVDFEWDSAQAALQMERGQEKIREEYLMPAMEQIKQEIDSRCAQFAYQNTNNIVGALATDPTSLTVFNQARQVMIEKAGIAQGPRINCIPPSVNTSLVGTALGLFNPPDAISKQYKEGAIGRYSGADWYESMSLYSHTSGTWQGAVTVDGNNQSGNSLLVNCTSGDTFKKGDVFGVANVYAVNPMTRRQTTTATTQRYLVTADTTATGSTVTLPVAIGGTTPVYGPGSQYQNVDALPVDAAPLTLFPGTGSPNNKSGKQGLYFNKGAFALVGVKLETPKAVEMSSQTRDPETGIALRFIRMFDPQQSKMINRFDVLMGFGPLRPDNCAVRVLCA
jgi:hypothetical protein